MGSWKTLAQSCRPKLSAHDVVTFDRIHVRLSLTHQPQHPQIRRFTRAWMLSYNTSMVKFLKVTTSSFKFHLVENKLFYLSLSLFFISLFLYSFGFQNQMFWDDDDFILKNVYVHDLGLWKHYFSENVIAGTGLVSNYWRPILLLFFGFEWKAFGFNTIGWHAVNSIFHGLNGILVFLLINKVFKKTLPAYLAAIIFVVHPVQTESVVYVNSFGDSLSVAFMLIAVLITTLRPKNLLQQLLFYLFSGLFYIFALLSKETSIITPLISGLVLFFSYPQTSIAKVIKNILKKTFHLWIIFGGYLIARATFANFKNSFNLYDNPTIFSESIFIRVLTFMKSLFIYLGLVFWPKSLHMERTIDPVTSIFSVYTLFGVLLILLVIWVIIKSCNTRPELSFGLLWFFIAFAPTSNILIPINGLLYEHWLYVPIIGFGLLFGYLVNLLLKNYKHYHLVVYILVFCLVIVLSIRSVRRIHEWQSPISLYTQTLKFVPTSYRVHNNLGMAYADINDFNQALKYYTNAIGLDDNNPVAYHNRANLFVSVGNLADAELDYKKAIELDPSFVYSSSQLYKLLIYEGKNEEADALKRSLCVKINCK